MYKRVAFLSGPFFLHHSRPWHPMESRSQKPFALILVLGLLILCPQLYHLSRRQEPPPATSQSNEQLSQVAKQLPHLLFLSISINAADAKQLGVIPGIGPELSRRIVAYRSAHGPFRTLDELDRVRGIGPRKLASLKAYCQP